MTKHSRSGSFLLLTENEAPQDALLSTESIEVRPLVPKGILRLSVSHHLSLFDYIPFFLVSDIQPFRSVAYNLFSHRKP